MNVRALIIAASVVFVGGCGASSKTNLSVSAKAVTSAAPATSSSLDLGNGISLDRVRVVVRKLKLEGTLASTSATPGTPCLREPDEEGHGDLEQEHDDEEIEPVLGPFLVDLSGGALSGGVQQAFDAAVPPGTFHEVKFVIGPIRADKAGMDAGLAEMAAQNASIIIDGTVTTSSGTSAKFTFKSSLKAQIEREGTFIVSDAKGNNITLSLNPKSWFGASGATLLDPTDPANQGAIEANIRASINAFEDDDRDGRDNEHEHDAEAPESDHVCTTPPPAACTYTYSDWSACANGSQTRTVVSATPADCTGTPGPLSQSCGASPNPL